MRATLRFMQSGPSRCARQRVACLSLVLGTALWGCPTRPVRTEPDADAGVVEVLEGVAPPTVSDVVDVSLPDVPSDAFVLDEPSATDAAPDVTARDAADDVVIDVVPDAPMDAPLDASGPTYRIDRTTELLSPRIGTAAIPFPTAPSNNKEGECADGLFGGVNMEEPRNPNDPVWVNRFQLLCQGLRADGRIAPPSSFLEPINMAPAGSTIPVGLERCPDGFVLVGLRGEETFGSYSRSWSASRIGAVCARVSEWVSVTDMRPTEATRIFERSYVPSPPDAGARDATADSEAGPIGSDSLVPLRACSEVDPTVPSCVFPIHGGRPTNPMGNPTQRRAFFLSCPGSHVPFAFAATAGYFVDALELRCARLRVVR